MPIELSLITGSRSAACALLASVFCLPASAAAAAKSSAEAARVRARAIGIAPGTFAPGPLNAITDVDGVRVGQVTLIIGESTRTGVTAVLPHSGNLTKVSEIPNEQMSPLFVAVADATEEAIYNSLLMATSMSSVDPATGKRVQIDAIDAAAVRSAVARRRGR